jgi:hypothetical protein
MENYEQTTNATPQAILPTKVCSKCKKEKPLTEFHRCLKSRDGRQSHCIDCQRAANLANYYKHKEKIQEEAQELALESARARLKPFTDEELCEELRQRGYSGELDYKGRIKI